MNTQQPTPGPWHVANDVQIRSEKHQIAKVWMMRNGEGNANARLIAAAPDLLNALREICEWTERYTSPGHPIGTVAKRAIANATGGGT